MKFETAPFPAFSRDGKNRNSLHKPMKSGTVKLVTASGGVIDTALYQSAAQWKKVTDHWKMVYGEKIIIQFAPDPAPTDFIVPIKKTKRLVHAYKKPIGGGINSIAIPKSSPRTHYL